MDLVKRISFLTAGIMFGVISYGCSTIMPGVTDTKEKMPKVAGERMKIRKLGSWDGKVKFEERTIGDINHGKGAFYLICNGKTEEKPYSVLTWEPLPSGERKITLYLDRDRNRFVDIPGKIIGYKNLDGEITGEEFLKHDVISDAPKCPNISKPEIYSDKIPLGI